VPDADALWRDWNHSESVAPLRRSHPANVDEVVAAIDQASAEDLSVKAVGAGHSFNDIGFTRGVMIQLDRMRGLTAVDRSTGLVSVAGGTTLTELGPALWGLGLSMTNLADSGELTISGAISTGTHGTGARFGGLATQVRGLELVTADGQRRRCSAAEQPGIFAAALTGLGALGVITEVTLQCEPAFALQAVESGARYDDVLESLPELVAANDYFEFFWFPHTRRVLTRTHNRLPGGIDLAPVPRLRRWVDDELLANVAFERVNRLTTKRPRLGKTANRIAARAQRARDYRDRSYRVFAASRRVRFAEMEYAVSVEALPQVLDGIDRWTTSRGEHVGFPVRVRFAAADEIPLSACYQRDSCYIAVHQYHRKAFERLFFAVGSIMRAADGRPHWGKVHYLLADELAQLYPRFGDFLAVREQLDPDRRFSNDYLRRVLGT
jgi:FAD-linked oxidoreductase